jgi:hypothetical protein
MDTGCLSGEADRSGVAPRVARHGEAGGELGSGCKRVRLRGDEWPWSRASAAMADVLWSGEVWLWPWH